MSPFPNLIQIRNKSILLTSVSESPPSYISQYPPEFSDTYVKATSFVGFNFTPWRTTDPSKLLIGDSTNNCWNSDEDAIVNQRFHIDLGSAKIIQRIYYENFHKFGGITTKGANNFTLWGSHSAESFAELTYGVDTGWIQITSSQNTFDIHVASDQTDPKFITLTNSTAYRYYAFKFADNHSGSDYMSVRRIELQTYD